jgi:hypothetical protein
MARMRRLALGVVLALLAFPAGAAAKVTLGENLDAVDSNGSQQCLGQTNEYGCTYDIRTIAGVPIMAHADGVIVTWRVRIGTSGGNSDAQKMRVRVIKESPAGSGTYTGDGTGDAGHVPGTPGKYEFPARVPIKTNELIGIDAEYGKYARILIDYGASNGTFDQFGPFLADG